MPETEENSTIQNYLDSVFQKTTGSNYEVTEVGVDFNHVVRKPNGTSDPDQNTYTLEQVYRNYSDFMKDTETGFVWQGTDIPPTNPKIKLWLKPKAQSSS